MNWNKKTLAAHYRQGMEGEEAAVAYLCAKGYEIWGRNYRFRRAEIDILAFRDEVLVVVEVKTRTKGFYKSLSHTVSPLKIQRLVRAADHFVRAHGLDLEVRFDIIQLCGKPGNYELTHLQNAFYHF
ncbi:YraN family protein [Robiginitalea sp.]|jgi:putative endonuclease|uniref:YraN family protein n=1 Tax=Robiginitalea sp. TaxID=1902411 RepID=UPI003C78C39F